jgi:hypothetical protein
LVCLRIGLIAEIAARNDDDAARRLYRKYRMEFRPAAAIARSSATRWATSTCAAR